LKNHGAYCFTVCKETESHRRGRELGNQGKHYLVLQRMHCWNTLLEVLGWIGISTMTSQKQHGIDVALYDNEGYAGHA
jgi:hypothetical protein